MFILLEDKILNREGEAVFAFGRHGDKFDVQTKEGNAIIQYASLDEARACLQALAEKLYAVRWDSQACCFVGVRYSADAVGGILRYMTEESFPPSLVEDVTFLVSMLNYSTESYEDIVAFIQQLRERDYQLLESAE